MGKSTISMVIFNSYFDITRGYTTAVAIVYTGCGRGNSSISAQLIQRIHMGRDGIPMVGPLGLNKKKNDTTCTTHRSFQHTLD